MGSVAIEETSPWWLPVLSIARLWFLVGLLAAALVVIEIFFVGPSALAGDILSLGGLIPGVRGWVKKPAALLYDKVNKTLIRELTLAQDAFAGWLYGWRDILVSLGHEIYGAVVQSAQIWYQVFYVHGLGYLKPHMASQARANEEQKAWNAKLQAEARAARKQAEAAQHAAIPKPGAVGSRDWQTSLHGFEEGVLTWERWAEHEISVAIPDATASLREQARSAEDHAINTFRWIRAHPRALASTVFAGAVAIALGRLGAGWTRCARPGKIGSALCRVPMNLIDDLIALFTDFLVLVNICQVLPWLEAGAADVAGPLISTLTKASAGLCSGGIGRPATLGVPELYLPPVVGFTAASLP